MATQAGEKGLRSGMEPTLSLAAMRIVRLLTGRPPAGIHDLAASLGVTATAVNEQMKRLLACGAVVRYQTPTRGRGRPKFLYSTAPAATAFGFVARPPLVPALWRAVRAIGGLQLLRQMIERGAAELAGDYQPRINGETPEERLLELAALWREEGQIVDIDWEPDGRVVLRRRSCPFADMLDEDRCVCQICSLVTSMLLDCTVRRSEWRLDGKPCCVFEISTTACGRQNTLRV